MARNKSANIDVLRTLLNLEGEPLSVQEQKPDGSVGNVLVTVRKILIDACLAVQPWEMQELEGKQKVERYNLALKIKRSQVVQFSSDEIAFLKLQSGKTFLPLIVGQLWPILDGQ